jgi:hypothetical protein
MAAADTLALLRSRSYLVLLVLAALLGVVVSVVAYGFLALVSKLQGWIFTSLPRGLGFHGEPLWWPVLPLALAGVVVGLTIRYFPGRGGHSPADGFKMGEGPPSPAAAGHARRLPRLGERVRAVHQDRRRAAHSPPSRFLLRSITRLLTAGQPRSRPGRQACCGARLHPRLVRVSS